MHWQTELGCGEALLIEFAEDFVDNPKEKIRRVFKAVDQFLPLCKRYGVEEDVARKIKAVLDGLVVDDLGMRSRYQ